MSKIIPINQKTNEKAIDKFFENDVLNFKNYPDEEISSLYSAHQNINHMIDTTIIKNTLLRQQYKDLIRCCTINEKPYKHKSSYYSYLLKLRGFFATNPFDDFLAIPTDACRTLFSEYCKENKIFKDAVKIIGSCQFYLFEYYDNRKGFDRDYWSRDMIHISKERRALDSDAFGFNFRRILNITGREYVKRWIKYLLGSTEVSYTSIIKNFLDVGNFLNYFEDQDILNLTSDDISVFIDSFDDIKPNSANKIIKSVMDFYDYLKVHKILTKDNPVISNHFFNDKMADITNLVDEITILQIFNHLHKLPFNLMLIYLINYSNGIRISDIVSLKVDCLSKHDDVYNLSYYCHKMKKDVVDEIPFELYKLLQEQLKIIKSLDYKEAYLFPSIKIKNKPFLIGTYTSIMKKYMAEWGITNADGTPYRFKTHAYRHTVATTLYHEYKVPSSIIQLGVLHHKELNMSLKYIERSTESNAETHKTYVNNSGQFIDETTDENFVTVKWLSDNVSRAILPNGVCSYPSILGGCPNTDVCLTCKHFRTSKEFLNIHKDQLAVIESKIPIYKANNFLPNLETALKTKEILEKIIASLEEIGGSENGN